MSSVTFKSKNKLLSIAQKIFFLSCDIIIKSIPTKLKQFYLHWISNIFSCTDYIDNCVVCCHVCQNMLHVRILLQDLVYSWLNLRVILSGVIDSLLELALKSWCKTFKIHKILSECTCFVKAYEVN